MGLHDALLRYVDWLLAHALRLRESGACDDAETLEQRAMQYLDEAAAADRSSFRGAITDDSEPVLMASGPR